MLFWNVDRCLFFLRPSCSLKPPYSLTPTLVFHYRILKLWSEFRRELLTFLLSLATHTPRKPQKGFWTWDRKKKAWENLGSGRSLRDVERWWWYQVEAGTQCRVSESWPTLRKSGSLFTWSPWAFLLPPCFFECPKVALWNLYSCGWVAEVKGENERHWSQDQ